MHWIQGINITFIFLAYISFQRPALNKILDLNKDAF